jgi:hypothetical protein
MVTATSPSRRASRREIEQRALPGLALVQAGGGRRTASDLGRDAGQHARHRREVALDARLDAGGGGLVRESETRELHREAGDQHERRGHRAGSNQPARADLPIARKDASHS